MRSPLLVIDGDSFAHRAYHALPKTIRRRGNKGAGAILGFASYLLRFYESEKPRAELVAWDTLDAPTYRHDALSGCPQHRRAAAVPDGGLQPRPRLRRAPPSRGTTIDSGHSAVLRL
jgi:5'-3' exonuclease